MSKKSEAPEVSPSSPVSTQRTPATSSNAGKSKKQKKSASSEGSKKIRTLSDVQLADCVKQLIADSQAGCFPEGKISMAAYTEKFNVSQTVFKDIYIKALQGGLGLVILDEDVVKNVADDTCYIDERWMCMIAKRFFIEYNKNLPDDEKFKPGQKFKPSQDGRNILLTFVG